MTQTIKVRSRFTGITTFIVVEILYTRDSTERFSIPCIKGTVHGTESANVCSVIPHIREPHLCRFDAFVPQKSVSAVGL